MIRVLIFDHSRLYRQSLALSLGQREGLFMLDGAASLDESIGRMRDLHPDVVLLRAVMPASFAAMRVIAETAPDVKIVALEVSETEEDMIGCAEAGIAGYLPQGGSLDDLVTIIQSVARGEVVCSPRMAATLLRRVAILAAERQTCDVQPHLTRREMEIAHLIDQGLSNKEIARNLCIDFRTVKNHVHSILEKFQVHRRGEAAAQLRGMHLSANSMPTSGRPARGELGQKN